MSQVTLSETFHATPERIWEVMMDPDRLGDWVTIHKELKSSSGGAQEGATMEQVLVLRGVPFTVKWRLTESTEPSLAKWEGKGPAGSRAVTRYELTPDGDRTRFDYVNEFHTPGGVLGGVASRVLVGGITEKEAQASLRRLKSLVEKD